jgi:hypothetical protein
MPEELLMKLQDLPATSRAFVEDLRSRGSLVLELVIDHSLAEVSREAELLSHLEGRLRALHEEISICLNGVSNFRHRQSSAASDKQRL